MENKTVIERPHTITSIKSDRGCDRRTVQGWYSKAKDKHGGEIGELRDNQRYFSDSERDMLLGFAAEPRSKVNRPVETPQQEADVVEASITVQSKPLHSDRFRAIEGSLTFNPAGFLGRTNGTVETVAAMDQVQALAAKLKRGIRETVAQAAHEYEQISDAAQGAQDQVRELELAISEGRAVTTILEMQKKQVIKSGIEAQAKIEDMIDFSDSAAPEN